MLSPIKPLILFDSLSLSSSLSRFSVQWKNTYRPFSRSADILWHRYRECSSISASKVVVSLRNFTRQNEVCQAFGSSPLPPRVTSSLTPNLIRGSLCICSPSSRFPEGTWLESRQVHVEGARRHRQLLIMKGSQNRVVRRVFKVEKWLVTCE